MLVFLVDLLEIWMTQTRRKLRSFLRTWIEWLKKKFNILKSKGLLRKWIEGLLEQQSLF